MIKDTFYVSISKVITYLFSLVSTMLLARMLTYADMGTYQQVKTLDSFVIFFLFGIPEAIIYFFSHENAPSEKKAIYLVIFVETIIVFLLCLLGNPFIQSYFSNPQLGEYSVQIAIVCATAVLQQCFSNVCVCLKHTRELMITTLVFSFLKLLICIACYYMKLTLSFFINLLSGYSIVFFFVQVGSIVIFEAELFSLKCKVAKVKNILVYALPLYLSVIVSKLCVLTDKLMIGYFYDTKTYAQYAIAARELPYTIITQSLIAVSTPIMFRMISEKRVNEAVRVWRQSVEYSFLFICFAVMLSTVMANEIISFLYSDKYLATKGIFLVYLFGLLVRAAYWGMFAKAYNRPTIIILESCGQLVLNIALDLILIKRMGPIGAAVATIVASYTSVAFWIFINSYLTKARIPELLPIRSIAKCSFICLVLGICLWLFKERILMPNGVDGLLSIVIVGLSGSAILFLVYHKELIYIAKRIVSRSNCDR